MLRVFRGLFNRPSSRPLASTTPIASSPLHDNSSFVPSSRLETRVEEQVDVPLAPLKPSRLASQVGERAAEKVAVPIGIISPQLENLIQTTSGNKDFMRLCLKHLMVPNLDSVQEITWLNNDSCNIFLIGEEHAEHTFCSSIPDMFNRLVHDISPTNPKIDLMIEYLQSDSNTPLKNSIRGLPEEQLNIVRKTFHRCINERNCPLHVHWTDPTQTNYDDPTKNVPQWLVTLAKSKIGTDKWSKDELITEHLTSEKDIHKIFTENKKVVSEIERLGNTLFTLQIAKDDFLRQYKEEKRQHSTLNWKENVVKMTRYVMDYFTVAKIIRLNLKNVIFYGGNAHTSRIIQILYLFKFKQMYEVKGACKHNHARRTSIHEITSIRARTSNRARTSIHAPIHAPAPIHTPTVTSTGL
jgi:hypothetical protein